MITVLCSTNRRNSLTAVFARYAHQIFTEAGENAQYFSLEDLPSTVLHPDMYESETQSPELAAIQDKLIIPANKFYFVAPEYNGSYPGILKLFLDACSIRAYKESFAGKKAGLLGVAAGRAGNLLGLDHLSTSLNHIGIIVMPNRQPIGGIEKFVNEQGELTDEATQKLIAKHVQQFIGF